MATAFSRGFERVYSQCRNDILTWAKVWNFDPTPQQKMVLEAVQRIHDEPAESRTKLGVLAASGRGTGKTALSVIISSWRQIRFPNTLTVVTAPNFRQASEIFIGEFRTLLGKGNPLLREIFTDISSKKIKVCGSDRWSIQCATASDPSRMAGYHDDHLGYIWEECGGIDRDIIIAMRGSLTNQDAFVYAPGNPVSRDSAYFDMFEQEADTWETFNLNSEESPIVSRDFIKTMERDYGKESDAYRVHVLGQFPSEDPDGVLRAEDVRACMTNDPESHRLTNLSRNNRQVGMDLARYGSDESVFYFREGDAIVHWQRFTKTDPNTVIRNAFVAQSDLGWPDHTVTYVVDAGGMGQGVMARFYEQDKQVVEFHNGARSADPQYSNKITEGWFNLRKLVRDHHIALPEDGPCSSSSRGASTARTTRGASSSRRRTNM